MLYSKDKNHVFSDGLLLLLFTCAMFGILDGWFPAMEKTSAIFMYCSVVVPHDFIFHG